MSTLRKTALVALLSSLASPVRADNLELHGTAAMATGYDTNVRAAPDPEDAPPNASVKDDAGVLQLTPGFVVDYMSPRMRWELVYGHPFLFYIGAEGNNQSADNAVFNLFFDATPRTQLTLGVTFNRFETGMSALSAAGNSLIGARPAGDNTALSFGVAEGLRHELSEFWRWEQTGNVGLFVPLASEQPIALVAGASTGPEYRYQDHALAALPTVAYTKPFVDSERAEELGYLTEEQLIYGGVARWRWDWTLTLGSELTAGINVITDLAGEVAYAPVGSASVLYTEEGYSARVGYRRAINPNIVTGQTYYSDTVFAQGRVPLVRDYDIAMEGSIGFSWNRGIDERVNVDTDIVNTFVTDAAVGWYPDEYPQVSIRYQHIEQFNAPPNQIVLPNYDRDAILIQASFTWPARTIEVPPGPAQRVDELDRDPLVDEGQDRLNPRSSGPRP